MCLCVCGGGGGGVRFWRASSFFETKGSRRAAARALAGAQTGWLPARPVGRAIPSTCRAHHPNSARPVAGKRRRQRGQGRAGGARSRHPIKGGKKHASPEKRDASPTRHRPAIPYLPPRQLTGSARGSAGGGGLGDAAGGRVRGQQTRGIALPIATHMRCGGAATDASPRPLPARPSHAANKPPAPLSASHAHTRNTHPPAPPPWSTWPSSSWRPRRRRKRPPPAR